MEEADGDALKIRCHSRRTCSSCTRQLVLSHWAGTSRGWSSGPFALGAAFTPVIAGATHRPSCHTGVVKLYPVIAPDPKVEP